MFPYEEWETILETRVHLSGLKDKSQLLHSALHSPPSCETHRAESIMTNSAEGDRDAATSLSAPRKTMPQSKTLYYDGWQNVSNMARLLIH